MLKGLLSWSNLADSAGRRVSTYALKFHDGFLEWDAKILALGATFVWTAFMLISTLTVTMMSWVSDPQWLNGLTAGYENLTKTAFGIVNPLYVAVGAFVILMVLIMADTAKSTSMKITKAEINRITAGIIIMLIVAVMVANPFAILRTLLSLAGLLVGVITGGKPGSVMSVDAMIRQPTLIVNYGGAVSESCAKAWSTGRAMPTGCYDSGADSASVATIFLAGLALMLAGCAFAFAVVSAWKFVIHLTAGAVCIIALPWVAAATIAKRRPFDSTGATLATAAGHFGMAVITQLITVAGPAFLSQLLSSWGQTDWAVLQLIVLSLGWVFLTAALVVATRRNGALARGLRADVRSTFAKFGGGARTERMLEKVSPGHAYTAARKKLTKGKAAEKDNTKTIKGRNGKTVTHDDLTDVQQTQQVNASHTVTVYVRSWRGGDEPPALGMGGGGGKPGGGGSGGGALVIDSEGNVLGWHGGGDEPPALGSGKRGGGGKPGGGSGGGGSVPFGDAWLDITNGLPDLAKLGEMYTAQQLNSADPMFGGRSAPDEVAAATAMVVMQAVRLAEATGQTATVTVDRVSASEVPLSAKEKMVRGRADRARRADADLRAIHASAADDALRVTVSVGGGAKAAQPVEAGSVWRRFRGAAVKNLKKGLNSLRGGAATRGDVRGGVHSDSMMAVSDAEVLDRHGRILAMSNGAVVAHSYTPDDDPRFDMRATPDSSYGSITRRWGLGFGDRID